MPDIVSEIEEIRTRNNKLWMQILRTALDYAPQITKDILSEINENDRRISDALGRLADE